MNDYYYLTIFLKIPIFLVLLEICSLIIVPAVFSSSVVPDYQAKKILVKPNNLQRPVTYHLNKSLQFVQLTLYNLK